MIDEFRDNPLKGIKNKWNGKKQMDVGKGKHVMEKKMLKQISADVDGVQRCNTYQQGSHGCNRGWF